MIQEKIVFSKHILGRACEGCIADEKNLQCTFDEITPIKVRYFEVIDKENYNMK